MVPSTATSPEELAPDYERRFGGLARLYGLAGARRIRSAHVLVVGIGGVGSWAAEALARSGVGKLTLIDMDHIAESNVNRQVHATSSTIGQSKVLAMRDRILDINPHCELVLLDQFVDALNWLDLVPQQLDAVIDACDQVLAKSAMCAWSRGHAAPKPIFLTVGAAGGKRLAHQVEIADLADVTHDPILSRVRYRLRKQAASKNTSHKKLGVSCVFSREPVQQPDASCSAENDGSLGCHGYGSVVSVTATFGHCAAGWVLDHLAKQAHVDSQLYADS